MTRLLPLLALAASCSAVALPFGSGNGVIEKRQLGDLMTLLGASFKQGIGRFMGEPEATESMIALARLFGATRTNAGIIMSWNKNGLNHGYGLVKDPNGSTPRRVRIPRRTNIPDSYTVKIRYGPYNVPNMNQKNGLGEGGMLSNYPHTNMEKPCAGDCTIIGMAAGLEYLDGSPANIDSGMWLHHMVLFNMGPGRQDPTCDHRDVSLPHVSMGSTARSSERIFASGNERSAAIFPEWGVNDAGYRIRPEDSFGAIVELMNENPQDKLVYMTMTYDVVDGHPFPDEIKCLWFDVRQCGTSEVNPPKGQNKFTLDYTWTSSISGEVVGSIGHLHDGGDTVELLVDGQKTCTNVAKYGTKPEYVQKHAMGHHANGALTHISELPACYGPDLPLNNIRPGQNWTLTANYDFNKNKGMRHADGEWDEVMGIAFTYVRVKGEQR